MRIDKREIIEQLRGRGEDDIADQAETELPDEVVERTRAKYVEAFERLTGSSFDGWLRES